MKKLLLTLLTGSLFAISANAQGPPDFGFEISWGGLGTNPQGWTSANILAGTPPVVKEDAVIWHWGSKSANITTKSIQGISTATGGLVPDISGLMLTGAISTFPTTGIKLGFPFSSRKDSLSFYVRYTPVLTDSGFVSVAMTKFNYSGTNKRDTIGLGIAKIGGQINEFTLKYAVINYTAPINVIPDTCVIVVSSSDLGNPQIGSTLWIDDLKWGTVNTGITEFTKNNGIKISPNPANEFIDIEIGNSIKAKEIEILDINGKLIESFAVNSKIEKFSIAHLADGLYFYAIKDNDAAVLSSGKITVRH
jgi:hypothetical protein